MLFMASVTRPRRQAAVTRTFALAVLFSFTSFVVSAQSPRDAARCTVEEATGRERMDANAKMVRSGQVLMPIWEEQLRLNGTAKQGDDQKTLRDLLSPQDAERFEVLREKSLPLGLSQTIESNRDRDAMVVAATSAMAWQAYRVPTESKVMSRFMACTEEERNSNRCKIIPEDQPGEAVFAMRILSPDPDTSILKDHPTPCNIDYALERQQSDALRLSIPMIESFNAKDIPAFERLKANYGVTANGSINKKKMTVKDRHETEGIETSGRAAMRSAQLVYDTTNILTYWLASKVMYQSRMEDLQTYGADEASFGKTLKRRSVDLPPNIKVMVGLWKIVEDSVPSEQDKLNSSNMDIINKDMGKRSNTRRPMP